MRVPRYTSIATLKCHSWQSYKATSIRVYRHVVRNEYVSFRQCMLTFERELLGAAFKCQGFPPFVILGRERERCGYEAGEIYDR